MTSGTFQTGTVAPWRLWSLVQKTHSLHMVKADTHTMIVVDIVIAVCFQCDGAIKSSPPIDAHTLVVTFVQCTLAVSWTSILATSCTCRSCRQPKKWHPAFGIGSREEGTHVAMQSGYIIIKHFNFRWVSAIDKKIRAAGFYLRNVQWRPFHPCEQTHVPFLHWPCSAQRASHGIWSHKFPVQPGLQRHLPDSHTPFGPQSRLHMAAMGINSIKQCK